MLASFGQGSNSIKSAEQGAGLGLPIAKSLVDLHGGTFTLKSKLRIGTEVRDHIPAGAGDVGARPAGRARPVHSARLRASCRTRERAGHGIARVAATKGAKDRSLSFKTSFIPIVFRAAIRMLPAATAPDL